MLQSKGAWLLVPLIILWGFSPTYAGYDALGNDLTIGYIQIGASVFLPLGALLLGYQSLVGERTTGSFKFLLALPLTRTQVLLGKVTGRSIGVSVLALLGFVGLALVGLFEYGLFSIPLYLATVLASLVLVAVFVAVAVSISALTKRTVTAAAAVFVFFLATFLWELIVPAVYTATTGVPVDPYNPPASGPLFLSLRLTPGGAYNVLTNWLFGVGNSADLFEFVYIQRQPSMSVNSFVVDTAFLPPEVVPWYLHPALSIPILLAWLIVPLGLARFVFDRGDAL